MSYFNFLHKAANPNQFMRVVDYVFWPLVVCAATVSAVGLYHGFVLSSADYQQGNTVRIMYVHVPAAYMATVLYMVIGISSLVWLIWKSPLSEMIADACAPVGMAFTAICLLSGMLWGKPMWGTYWVWDARLTSVLVLFFLYLGYMSLRKSFDDPTKAQMPCAVLAILGLVNLPIIKFSVDWWNSLHQPASLMRFDGPRIAPDILSALLWMLAAVTLWATVFVIIRLRGNILERKLFVLQRS